MGSKSNAQHKLRLNKMSKELIEALLPINCAYNYKEEYRDETTTMGKCYSKTCMLNQNKDVANDIQNKGCEIYKKDFVKAEIARKPDR